MHRRSSVLTFRGLLGNWRSVISAQQRIIEAAERLFAERGLDAVPVHAILAAAQQRNSSAVHYHFGSKAGLIEAILHDRIGRIDQRRAAMLADLKRRRRHRDLRALVEAGIRPVAEEVQPGSCHARFVARVFPHLADTIVARQRSAARSAYEEIRARLWDLMRGLPPAVRHQRLLTAARIWIYAIAAHEQELESAGPPTMRTEALVEDLIDVVVATLRAPTSAKTRKLLQDSLRPGRAGSRSRSRSPKARK